MVEENGHNKLEDIVQKILKSRPGEPIIKVDISYIHKRSSSTEKNYKPVYTVSYSNLDEKDNFRFSDAEEHMGICFAIDKDSENNPLEISLNSFLYELRKQNDTNMEYGIKKSNEKSTIYIIKDSIGDSDEEYNIYKSVIDTSLSDNSLKIDEKLRRIEFMTDNFNIDLRTENNRAKYVKGSIKKLKESTNNDSDIKKIEDFYKKSLEGHTQLKLF